MATRRNERVPVTGADEALERFLKFRPPEFYGDVEQEIKDALRVTFAAFRLRGMAKDWWLRASEARTLKNQLWTWNDFQEEFKKEYIPRWLPCHRWDSRPQLKPLSEQRWLIKRLYKGKQPVVQRRLHINVLDKDHGNLEISRDPVVNKGLEMKADQP
ncbi:hypothetical protein M9H77_28003 [Catharanthus roseus]|uniref:Uncharacterized protein n=1 Tax=Catharanthus roseus TaxID=4058 RepID=A0ACC0AG04_CATRO|nr:hypothetical protein M9H77_28003 [Catharanthus roseus]